MKPELKTGLIVLASVLVGLAAHQFIFAPMIAKLAKSKTPAPAGK